MILPMVHVGILQGVYCDRRNEVLMRHFNCNSDAMVSVQDYMQVVASLKLFWHIDIVDILSEYIRLGEGTI
jgi:hypothetical protein